MKQHITPKQLNELSEKGKEMLMKWWKPRRYDVVVLNYHGTGLVMTIEEFIVDEKEYKANMIPLLSIGQMIQFLDENNVYVAIVLQMPKQQLANYVYITDPNKSKNIALPHVTGEDVHNKELCDALWEAVKEVLNEKENTRD